MTRSRLAKTLFQGFVFSGTLALACVPIPLVEWWVGTFALAGWVGGVWVSQEHITEQRFFHSTSASAIENPTEPADPEGDYTVAVFYDALLPSQSADLNHIERRLDLVAENQNGDRIAYWPVGDDSHVRKVTFEFPKEGPALRFLYDVYCSVFLLLDEDRRFVKIEYQAPEGMDGRDFVYRRGETHCPKCTMKSGVETCIGEYIKSHRCIACNHEWYEATCELGRDVILPAPNENPFTDVDDASSTGCF